MLARWPVVPVELAGQSRSTAATAVETAKVVASCTLIHGSTNQPMRVILAIAVATTTANHVANADRYLMDLPVCGAIDVTRPAIRVAPAIRAVVGPAMVVAMAARLTLVADWNRLADANQVVAAIHASPPRVAVTG